MCMFHASFVQPSAERVQVKSIVYVRDTPYTTPHRRQPTKTNIKVTGIIVAQATPGKRLLAVAAGPIASTILPALAAASARGDKQ